MLSRTSALWGGITLENYSVPAVFIPRREHSEHFLHLVVQGTVRYGVTTKGRTLRFTSRPGTTFLLPHGTVDEVNWTGPTQRMAVAIHPHLLKRYAVHRQTPVVYRGGLPGYRLRRVLNYIGDNLAENLSLSQLAAVAGMSPHYLWLPASRTGEED